MSLEEVTRQLEQANVQLQAEKMKVSSLQRRLEEKRDAERVQAGPARRSRPRHAVGADHVVGNQKESEALKKNRHRYTSDMERLLGERFGDVESETVKIAMYGFFLNTQIFIPMWSKDPAPGLLQSRR